MFLRCCQFKLTFPRPAMVMGIVNVTPDSFSDGGKFLEREAAVEHAVTLIKEGAEIIDVGGESTRPGAIPVSEAEELRRVVPVIEELARRFREGKRGPATAGTPNTRPKAGAPNMPAKYASSSGGQREKLLISIDTMKPAVARAALRAGASIVNDVAANREDEAMWRVVADAGAGYVIMHMQGTPQTMQRRPSYTEVGREVGEFFLERLKRLKHCGMVIEQTILDPGIGFGKTREHNMQLLGALPEFGRLERPLLLGVSRKSFLAAAGEGLAERLPAALACACHAVGSGVQMIRTHDVAATVRAIRMMEEILKKR